MDKLLKEIEALRKSPVRQKVEKRLKEFRSVNSSPPKRWFSELCFCILTANSKAKTALGIEAELGQEGFCSLCLEDVRECIRKHKHRFHNNKAAFIIDARKHIGIKKTVKDIIKADGLIQTREWIVRNIKGIGYKEASHFLRNVGYADLAILDRHILNLMVENGFLEQKPKSLNRKNYLEIERIFLDMAKRFRMSGAELDMYMWYMKTGEVLK